MVNKPRTERGNKFKAVEKHAKEMPNLQWEGEEVAAESTIKLEDDKGIGEAIVLRFFDFGANLETFKQHKPTAQEMFDSHRKGIESLLWRDGLKPYEAVQPRLMFSKDKSHYRFIVACVTRLGNSLTETPQTLSQLLTSTKC